MSWPRMGLARVDFHAGDDAAPFAAKRIFWFQWGAFLRTWWLS